MRRLLIASLTIALLGAVGSGPASAAGGPTSPAAEETDAAPSEGEEGYRPKSNVDDHSAIGRDAAAIREAMAPATREEAVDWAAVSGTFEKGGASKKPDGSIRTLAALVPDSPTVPVLRDAIAGTGASEGASDAIRRQQVDKGISVLLAEKVLEELGRARAKIEAGQLEPPATGAVHNVDEAWAFFSAEGQGPALTAERRAADFGREGGVKEPVLVALADAQDASVAGDLVAFDAAAAATGEALGYIFYLATYKYLDYEDEIGRAEGEAFYRGISPVVEAADAEAHQAILDAFAAGDAAAGRAALNREAVREALGVDDSEQETS